MGACHVPELKVFQMQTPWEEKGKDLSPEAGRAGLGGPGKSL